MSEKVLTADEEKDHPLPGLNFSHRQSPNPDKNEDLGSIKMDAPLEQTKGHTLEWLLHLAVSLILLYCFLVGVKLLGSSIKNFGGGFASSLLNVTHNPFVGVFVGILTTALFQSSSVTTSIVVGIVSAGTLPLESAIPVILGANIGTSVTNTLVSLGHLKNRREFKLAFGAATVHDFFNILTVSIVLPLEVMTGSLSWLASHMAGFMYGMFDGVSYKSPIKALIKPPVKYIESFAYGSFTDSHYATIFTTVLSFVIILLSLTLVVKNMKSLVTTQAGPLIHKALSRPVWALSFGAIVTILVQSSSITTSLMVPLAGSGLLTLEAIFPITIGANIGTTGTALLAAMTGNLAGLSIALVHFLFNLLGFLIWYPSMRMRQVPLKCAYGFASLVQKNRLYALAYLGVLFFLIPVALIFMSR